MGNTYIPVKSMFDDLGVPFIIPADSNKEGLKLGTRISPEQVCLPFKINIGNYLQAISKGADTILLTGSCGPCRFGYYGILQKEILEEHGYHIDFIILDPPQGQYRNFLDKIKKITPGCRWYKILTAFQKAIAISFYADNMDRLVFKTRAYEIINGQANQIYNDYHNDILHTKGSKEIKEVIGDSTLKLNEVPIDMNKKPLKIGIVGEIFTIIEPYVNLNIERRLGEMGVEVDRSLMVSEWVKDKLLYKTINRTSYKNIYKKAAQYLDHCIGGHAWECIGNSILYKEKGFDGVIQIYPFGCMPEIVAKSILPTIANDFNLPIMSLIVDEMTGENGYQTRLEAFVDLLYARRRKDVEVGSVLFRN